MVKASKKEPLLLKCFWPVVVLMREMSGAETGGTTYKGKGKERETDKRHKLGHRESFGVFGDNEKRDWLWERQLQYY